MIEFDESEYLESAVSDLTLSWVLSMYGQKVKDKLLYAPIRLDNSNPRRDLQTRPVTCSIRGGGFCATENQSSEEEDAPIFTLGDGIGFGSEGVHSQPTFNHGGT